MARFTFTLYIAGESDLSHRAQTNFERIIRSRLGENCQLHVIDIVAKPELAREHRILATPLLVREEPEPTLRILGDLSKEDQLLAQLGLEFHTDEFKGND